MLFSEPKIPQTSVSLAHTFPSVKFQCSSASRKFLKRNCEGAGRDRSNGFSALQRAENSSNRLPPRRRPSRLSFSALQRAENSSNYPQRKESRSRYRVSVLFSEPKIPQINARSPRRAATSRFSALQRAENSSNRGVCRPATPATGFQCSSASRKFLKFRSAGTGTARCWVSVLFSEPKIPQTSGRNRR